MRRLGIVENWVTMVTYLILRQITQVFQILLTRFPLRVIKFSYNFTFVVLLSYKVWFIFFKAVVKIDVVSIKDEFMVRNANLYFLLKLYSKID